MLLMIQVFAFNSMTSCVSYYFYSQTKSVFDLPLVVGAGTGATTATSSASASVNGKTNIEEYLRGMIVETRGMRWKMYASSTSASIVLGIVSFIAAQYDY